MKTVIRLFHSPIIIGEKGTGGEECCKRYYRWKIWNLCFSWNNSEPPTDMTEEQVMEYATNYANIFLQKGAGTMR